jgi:hypothetical protein
MLDALKPLLENNVISNEIKESLETAWNDKITENRQIVAQELREEFAQKYEHDKHVMLEAVNRLITDQLDTELSEFIADRKQLAEMKVKYAKAMNKSSTAIKEFVTKQLVAEVKELHEDTTAMANKFSILENFVVEALAQEITEFQADKQDLAETKVKLIREGREKFTQVKEQFIKRASTLVESVVSKSLTTEITALKEDIESARRADFGRKLFEAFASEYSVSYLNEKSETAKLLKVIKSKDAAISEAADAVVKAEKVLESKQFEIRMLKEQHSRKDIMNELLAPLNADQKSIMSDLMESVATHKLNDSFDKYLPAVVAGKSPQRKQTLVETKIITGNKVPKSNRADSDIYDMRKLAGLEKY